MSSTDDPVMPSGSKLLKITVVVAFGPFLAQLDTTVINIALSTLSKELNAPLDLIQWVTTGYLLALALMIPLTGWLVDRIGAKRVYVACFAMFTLTSTLCGFATSANELIGFRILQGMAGGLLAPLSQMTIARHAGPHMAKMMALMTMPVMTAPIFGPSLAGVVLHLASWHWLFFVNVPIGIAAIILAIMLLPTDGERKERRLDVFGFLLISPGLVLLLDGLKHLATNNGPLLAYLGEISAAIVLLIVFVLRGIRLDASNLFDLRLFKGRSFSTSALMMFLGDAIGLGGQMIFPLFLLVGLAMEPAVVGLLLAPMGIGNLIGRPFGERLMRQFGPRRVAMSGALMGLGATLPFVWSGAAMPVIVILVALFVRGVGQGLYNLSSVVSAYGSVPQSSLSDGATVINIAQRLGGPVATMSIALLLQYLSDGYESDADDASLVTIVAFHAGFALLCFISFLGAISAWRLPAQQKRGATL